MPTSSPITVDRALCETWAHTQDAGGPPDGILRRRIRGGIGHDRYGCVRRPQSWSDVGGGTLHRPANRRGEDGTDRSFLWCTGVESGDRLAPGQRRGERIFALRAEARPSAGMAYCRSGPRQSTGCDHHGPLPRPDREGPFANVWLGLDLALERNDRIDMRAWAGRVQVGYAFANIAGAPALPIFTRPFQATIPPPSGSSASTPFIMRATPAPGRPAPSRRWRSLTPT